MLKKISSIVIILLFSACSLKFDQNVDLLNINNLKNKQIKYTTSYCTNSSYILNANSLQYGSIFTEDITLDINCNWNGFSRGYFMDLFENSFKFKSIKVIERIDVKNYEFTTYLIDEKYYLNLIYRFSSKNDRFILDYQGKLSNDLLEKYAKKYSKDYSKEKRFSKLYFRSLVDLNIVNNYFQKERVLLRD